MSEQLSIMGSGFDMPPPAPRVRKPAAVKPILAPELGHADVILAVLTFYGDLAAHEVAAYCRLNAIEVGRRLPGMHSAGLIEPATDQDAKAIVRKSPAGRSSQVWRAT